VHEPGLADRAWWKVHGRRFALAAAITASGVVGVGWLTGARDVMYGALLSFAIAALLPLVIIAAGVALIMLVVLVTAIAAAVGDPADPSGAIDGGVGMIEGGARLAPRYYAFLSRRRHPAFWGIGLGVLLGGLILWAAIAIFVMPGEARTVDRLHQAQARIELHYAEHGAFPASDAEHRLVLDGEVIEDGHGRPFEYRVRGRWRLAVWQLRSHGYDGEPSRDDLCAAGGTPVVKKLEAAAKLLELSRRTRSLGERLESVNAMRCER